MRTARAGASVELVCRLLEVSRSGYYEWLGRKPSLRRQKDQELKRRLLSLHQRYPALGLDSLYHLIRPQLSCSRKRIHRLMNEMNISSTRRRAYKATTNSRHAHPIAPNLLARRFSFDKPDTAWVGDITYIPTGEGWLYCAVVKDLCTKQIVGYAFSDRIDTNLTLAALGIAPIPDLPDRKTICIMERGNEKCQPKNESTQRRRVTMRPSRRGQCGWSPSRGGPAGRWPRNSASASTRCAAG
ncbi:MAG: IS3 family transposase [Ruthenibacterium lactatiformans]